MTMAYTKVSDEDLKRVVKDIEHDYVGAKYRWFKTYWEDQGKYWKEDLEPEIYEKVVEALKTCYDL